MSECRRFRVSGFVQGVGFRYYTQKQAIRLGLVGWVRNLADGDVESIACGGHTQLDEFYAWLQTGPTMARVRRVDVETTEETEVFTGFSVY